MGFKETFIGDGERYNYRQMCIPQLPWRKSNAKLNFYAKGKSKKGKTKNTKSTTSTTSTTTQPLQVSSVSASSLHFFGRLCMMILRFGDILQLYYYCYYYYYFCR
jgi:hypothetical protein